MHARQTSYTHTHTQQARQACQGTAAHLAPPPLRHLAPLLLQLRLEQLGAQQGHRALAVAQLAPLLLRGGKAGMVANGWVSGWVGLS